MPFFSRSSSSPSHTALPPAYNDNPSSAPAHREPRSPAELVLPRAGGGDQAVIVAHLSDHSRGNQPAALNWDGPSDDEHYTQEGMPPDYAPAILRSIATNTIFTFKPSTFNMMVLTPAHEEQSSVPIMNISVALNCFNPACFITTVRSGPSPESGAFIGEFEMGDSKQEATVTIGQEQKPLDTVLSKWKSGVSGVLCYGWHFLGRSVIKRQLSWTQDGHTFKCNQGTWNQPLGDTIAIFRTNPLAAPHDGRRRRPPTIEIWPQAYNNPTMLIHIIMSALIIERKRVAS